MKAIVRSVFIYAAAIWTTSTFMGGISYDKDLRVLFLASLALAIGHVLIVPLINLLLLPINILTLGSFRWVSVVILLVAVTFLVNGFTIGPFMFPAISTPFFGIPSFHVGIFISYVFVAFALSIFSGFFFWLAE